MSTSQDGAWKAKETSEEARYAHQKEQEQLAALRAKSSDAASSAKPASSTNTSKNAMDRDFEGGYGGQEDLEDRYATTSGEH